MKKLVMLVSGLMLTAGLTSVATTVAHAAGPPLSDYVVYGENGVVVGHDSTVIGLVGGKNGSIYSSGWAVKVNGSAAVLSDPVHGVVGDIRSGGKVQINNQGIVQGTITHTPGTLVSVAASATVGAIVAADPMLPTLPPATVIPGGCPTAGANDTGGNNATRTPAPGTYGNWDFGGGFTLNLTTPGTYIFNSLKAANSAVINVVPGVKVLICQNFDFGGTTVNAPPGMASGDFTVEAQSNDQHNAFRSGGSTNWIGDVYTPNGGLHIGSGGSVGTVNGHLWAEGVADLEHGLVVQASGGHNQSGGGGVKDATLLHGQKVENNGANNSLLVHYQVASVVGFDATAIDTANVHKAILRLTVCNTPGDFNFCPEAPHDWPANGGPVQAFRLVDGWERWGSGEPNPTNTPPEGNGNNFPIDNNPRGNGAGVTWDCAIDPNIANQAIDCKQGGDFWNAGLNFQGPERPSVNNVTNNMADGATIDFDVTADVLKGLGPLDKTFMTWFIRKVSSTGTVTFYSVQGAAAKGNPALAPQLIIT